jgi:hypothetical protein
MVEGQGGQVHVVGAPGGAGVGHGHAHNHNVSIDWDSIKWDELTPEEKWNYEHIRLVNKNISFI